MIAARVLQTNGSGHGALAGFLKAEGADALICGGIGGGAQMALADAGIRLYAGVEGDADAAVEALLRGELHYANDATCSPPRTRARRGLRATANIAARNTANTAARNTAAASIERD